MREAIHGTLATLPESVLFLQQNLVQAQDFHEKLVRKADVVRTAHRRRLDQMERIEALTQSVDGFAAEVAAAGLSEGEVPLAEVIAKELVALEIAAKVRPFLAWLTRAENLCDEIIQDKTFLVEAVPHLVAKLSELAQNKGAELARLEERLAYTIERKNLAARRQEEMRQRLNEVAEHRSRMRVQREEFDRLWWSLSQLPPNQERCEAIRDAQENMAATINKAAAHLDAAEAARRAVDEMSGRAQLEAEVAVLREKVHYHSERRSAAESLHARLSEHCKKYVAEQLGILRPVLQSFFMRAHSNRFIETVDIGEGEELLRWNARATLGEGGESVLFDSQKNLSDGQRQDLALAVFLARACTLGGTFFLDEPLAHLDDLNRVAVLDVLRMLAVTRPDLNLVLTTASRPLVRHLREKFARLTEADDRPLLKVVELDGNPIAGVVVKG